MSYLKFSPNLFLESQELNRLKKFLDNEGFRQFLLDNSVSYGFIKKHNEEFINGLVSEDVSFTVAINEATLINSVGNVIYTPAIQQLAVPNDNNWYWIKITQAFSSNELGTFSIDTAGNLTCTSLDAELLTILRGQPNYPSRVVFTNAASNILEYDVEEVIDNNNAVLTGAFTAETGLKLSVIGTFTPGYVALSSEKNIFQYDYSTISLVQSNTSSEPSHTTGSDFFLARVKRNGSSLKIEDKRNDIWTTNANYYAQHLTLIGNPLIGVEQITYDDAFTPRDKNIVEIGWGFRGITFTVDLKNNKVTISAGSGGIFRSTNFDTVFTDGDFDGWRLYSEDGKYYKVQTSVLNGGTIELNFDNLEATSFYSDVNSIVPISQTLIVVPEAEEIEIICTPEQDISDSTSQTGSSNGLVEVKKVFPINEAYGRIKLVVYDETNADYTITYRYKHLLSYGPTMVIPDDSVGYYNESQFTVAGHRSGSSTTPYTNGLITLRLNSLAYVNFQARVDRGDLFGVETVQLTNSTPALDLVVGQSKQYQYFNGTALTLSADMYINLNKEDINGAEVKNGNSFILHFKHLIDLNSFVLKIVTDYVDPLTFTLVKQITAKETSYIFSAVDGFYVQVVYDGTDWIVKSMDQLSEDWVAFDSYTKYRKDGDGYVHLVGVIGSGRGTQNSALPVGYRPKTLQTFYTSGVDVGGGTPINANAYALTISTAGVINAAFVTGAGTDRIQFTNGVSFKAEQ